ncbi:MAG TPA: FkbM family methyltransferase [Candidatus Acidoferrum sp.]|nr:FkbM family methyltransferase [Candidatus Acidoferrum sp.]
MNAPGPGRFSPLDGKPASLPPFPGRLRVIGAAASLISWFGKNEREVSLWPGARFSVDLRDRIQRQMWCASYEPHVTHCLKSILRPGDTFVDVGAHIGYHSFYAAGVVGTTGRVFSFEPDPSVYARLKRNLEPFPHTYAFHCAVWEREAELLFERSSCAQESGWGSLTTVRTLGTGEQIPIRAVSLDGWSREIDSSAVRAIKMDAEGSELAVLKGATKLIGESSPVLLLEVNDVVLRQGGASGNLILSEVRNLGYRIYEIRNSALFRLEIFEDSSFADCLCLPEEGAERLLGVLIGHGFQI